MSEIVFFGYDMLSVSLIINLVFPFLKINPILKLPRVVVAS